VALAGAVLLASCGGGTSQVEPFVPARLVVFGDEMSLVAAGGVKYTVNALKAAPDTGFDCSANPVWTQVVASGYGFSFDSCPVAGTDSQKGVMRAVAGATAATLQGQVNSQADGLGKSDLVTVMAGIHDVIRLHDQVGQGTLTLAEADAQAREAGRAIGRVVFGILGTGARVIVAKVPNMGLSPRGIAGDAARMTRLSIELNAGLTCTFLSGGDACDPATNVSAKYDGRSATLVMTDELVEVAVKDPAAYQLSVSGVTTAACDIQKVPQPPATGWVSTCTSATLAAALPSASIASEWLWADDIWFAPGGHRNLGSRALSQARSNPF
jgi:hypothetical protein